MTIHVVQQGESIYFIADLYGVPVERIIEENGLDKPFDLVPGQTIVITYPEQIHIVQAGDTLPNIANAYGVTLLELLKNNPLLSGRMELIPGETVVISYNRSGLITTNGYAFDFINRSVLMKTLPYLTYLSIYSYRVIASGEIIGIDETELIQTAKNYGVAPLMIISTLTPQGQENREAAYRILSNEALMDTLIDSFMDILRTKGYYGINLIYQYLTNETLPYYEVLSSKLNERAKSEGFFILITIAPHQIFQNYCLTFERIDYSNIAKQADLIILLNLNWGYSMGPPAPIASISIINEFLDFLEPQIPFEKLVIGQPLIGYDWLLPYNFGITRANSLTLDYALALARQTGATIQFDEQSQTPYFYYNDLAEGIENTHIVWFIDARSIDALFKVIIERGLNGGGVWNIMYYNSQLWLIINSQYEIENRSQ